MDFRHFNHQALHEYMMGQGIKSYDLVAVPGSGKAILDEKSRASIVNAVKISLELHESKTIYIIHHRDCGAYGGRKAFQSSELELEHHKSELKNARQLLQKEIGSFIPIKTVFFDTEVDNKGNHLLKAVNVM